MNFKKLLKVISAIVAVAGVIAAVYIAIQKLTAHKEPEYFDDNDFFECDNEIEIVEAKAEEAKEEPKEEYTDKVNSDVEELLENIKNKKIYFTEKQEREYTKLIKKLANILNK